MPIETKPTYSFNKFDVYWWVASSGSELCRYTTRNSSDIEIFSSTHFRIHAHSLDRTGDILEIILTKLNDVWNVKCDDFDSTETYPFSFAESKSQATWTDATGDELMVIQATLSD